MSVMHAVWQNIEVYLRFAFDPRNSNGSKRRKRTDIFQDSGENGISDRKVKMWRGKGRKEGRRRERKKKKKVGARLQTCGGVVMREG